MSGQGGADFAEADRANEYEAARAERYWADRETAADRKIDAVASMALLLNPDDERVLVEVGGERVWAVRTDSPDEFVVLPDEELRAEQGER
ncbi:hypothetical protein L3Q65_00145 (plasmid) [Amycolatopsis sp. FU40]|uniref:hypothetical protein n=1 Tax=Amycolatopsis sp. FU40 TaxID=2914159 RepID=UPI001F48B2AB|nr:hypothetical protein [Amycolatopsis sp. FU40]UKD50769.1 hypothetical protein L3Q65_00145 [Amycolatopsis sp. FU40]